MFDIKIKGSIGRIIIMLLVLSITIIGGTFAWFTYKSRESALVLSIGDINDSRVIIEPYQIRETLVPTNSYIGGVYSQITAINNNSNKLVMNLFYKVNQIDELLINNGLRYTIVSSNSKDGEYKEVDTGDFTGISNNKLKILNIEIDSNKIIYYRVYLWLDTNAGNQIAIQNSVLDVELNGDINQVANQPILDEGMVPVVIYEDGTVMTTNENDLDWYDYGNQKWANIVLVNENASSSEGSKSREYYLNNPGTEVLESDILAYYVWIPRYKYKIWTTGVSSTGEEQSIEIVFESRYDEMSLGTNVGEYRSHPAFWWDNDNDSLYDEGEMLPGIWVGKFETTGSATQPTVKPNTASLTNQTLSAQFNTSLLFAGGSMNVSTGVVSFIGNNTYGLTDKTNSHMMKNSEWGAAAYLSHSVYGKNTEITINGNSSLITGAGNGTLYGNITSGDYTYPQSTTGNITGIFDMSGGGWERVMGVLADSDGNPRSGQSETYNSGYNGSLESGIYTSGISFPDSKYYDLYTVTSNSLCTLEECGGHALYETASWYSDNVYFVNSEAPWFGRGGYYGSGDIAGMFYFNIDNGNINSSHSWRSVLIPNMNYTVNFDANGGFLDENNTVHEIITYTTSGEYEFIVPYDGEYQLEVWGAQGSASGGSGGYGGYSIGTVSLTEDQKLYVNVGGVGVVTSGGYNGGGNGSSMGSSGTAYKSGGGGGGATHIATKSGQLYSLENNTSDILIVAGGGGGGAYISGNYAGGAGGGISGVTGTGRSITVAAGNQTTGYSFGKGQNGLPGSGGYSWGESGRGGGGGGFYGGNASQTGANGIAGGGGGSGYIGNELLTDKYMYCYNCTTSDDESTLTYTTTNVSSTPVSNYAKSGAGAAKISFLRVVKEIIYGYKYGNMPEPTREGYVFAGWYTEPEGGIKVTEDTNVDVFGTHTLYARWADVDLNINYSVNGGVIDSSTTNENTTYNWSTSEDKIYLNGELYISNISGTQTINLPNYNDSNFMNITRDNYGIKEGEEWICLSGCKKNNMIFSQDIDYKVSDFCDGSNSKCNIVLGVNWLKAYTITYDANGGLNAPSSQIKYHGVAINLTSLMPSNSKYAFAGWSTDSNATSASYLSGEEFTINENITLYAVWTEFNPLESYSCANGSVGSEPYHIEYTGNCTVIDDGEGNWKVKLLTDGVLTTTTNTKIDTFLVGGGGGGGTGGNYNGGGGGAGGYTMTKRNISTIANVDYEVVIGAGGAAASNGGNTSAFGFTANGGKMGSGANGGDGGSGGGGGGYSSGHNAGGGGSDGKGGGNGSTEGGKGGQGQGTTTREFEESTGDLYSGGGGGAAGVSANGNWSSAAGGGSGGGGYGNGSSAAANTGGGGGGGNPNKTGGRGGSGIVVIRNRRVSCSSDDLENATFDFDYSGNCTVIDDGDGNWRIKFLTSGELIFTSSPGQIDAFLVGGGGAGANHTTYYGSGGGGGGYTITEKNINTESNIVYEIIVGSGGASSNGGNTSAFGFTANGGKMGSDANGGDGGSGGGGGGHSSGHNAGAGGSNGGGGGNGSTQGGKGGKGQGTTTREFGESTGTLYSGGGGGGAGVSANGNWSSAAGGGSGGGGYGNGSSGAANTGGGGGGNYGAGGYGGSGIVVIRNRRISCSSDDIENATFDFNYSGNCEAIDDGDGNWRIKFLSSGKLTFTSNPGAIDLFLVGGGGSGANHTTYYGSGGGGGGYTITEKNVNTVVGVEYEIIVGSGGAASDGGNTSAFGFVANGGKMASGVNGGAGGSGGGGGGSSSNCNGGNGGSNGGSGGSSSSCNGGSGGSGQGSTTREFGESTGTLYSGGGGGGYGVSANGNPSSAGAGGGGGGGSGYGGSGGANTGGGGGGHYGAGGYGGSGIAIIRNKR